MVRTQRGNASDRVAKLENFGELTARFRFGFVQHSMLVVALVVLLAFVTSVLSPPTAAPPSASELVAVPGINPVIPLLGALAFIVLSFMSLDMVYLPEDTVWIRSFGLLQLGPPRSAPLQNPNPMS